MTAVIIQTDPDTAEGDLPHAVPRRPRSRGVGPLDTGPTLALAMLIVISTAVMTFIGFVPGLVSLAITIVVGLLLVWHDVHHRGPIEKGVARARWAWVKHKGWDWFLPGSLTHFGKNLLPGTGTQSILTDGEDVMGHNYALITYPQTGHHVVNISTNPNGSSLTDPITVTKQADAFGKWLTSLGTQPDLEQAAISITIAPDAYPALVREINENLQSDAPQISKDLLNQCLDVYPKGGSTSQSGLSLTFNTSSEVDRKQFRADSGIAATREYLSIKLSDILAALPSTGAGSVALMDAESVVEKVSCAFSPDQRRYYQELRARGERTPVKRWNQAGPGAAVEHWDSYDHAGATSIVYEVTGFTNHQVAPRAMKPILQEPPPGIHSIRVTWLYRPVSPARSGFIAEADHAAAEQRQGTSKKPSARVKQDVKAADRTRHLEAHGSGLINTAILVTVTVLPEDEDQKPKAKRRARSAIDRLGPAARLRLRTRYGTQASSFSQAVHELGLVTAAHLTSPTAFKKIG